jgi:hypothetical protein
VFSRYLSQRYSRILAIMALAAAMLLLLFFTMSWAAQAAEDRSPQLIDSTLNQAYAIDAANNISSTISNDEALVTGDEGTADRANSHQWNSGVESPNQVQTNGNQTFQLFAGTALNPVGTNNSAYEINVYDNISATIFSGRAVWGATYDVVNDRVLFTSDGGIGGDLLYQWSPDGGAPTLVGTITITGTSTPFRIDGLAISNGVLYGSRAAATQDGIYLIDSNTLSATLVLSTTDSISGIDADPNTGTIYGVNDTITSVVEIDITGGMITPVASYPDPAETDIDGLAIGPNGRAYLIPDDPMPGLIYVYNLNTGSYETPLTAPWVGTDTFSGGAFIYHNVYLPTILKPSGP